MEEDRSLMVSPQEFTELTHRESGFLSKSYFDSYLGGSLTYSVSEGKSAKHPIKWIRIEQIAYNETQDLKYNIAEIQKVIFATFAPEERELAYLVSGDGKSISIYIGIRELLEDSVDAISLLKGLKGYISSLWPGTKLSLVPEEEEPKLEKFKSCITITGIPSKTYDGKYAREGAIDSLLGQMSNKAFTYLVCASPVSIQATERLIDSYSQKASIAESVKQSSISQSQQEGNSLQITEGESNGEIDSTVINAGVNFDGLSVGGAKVGGTTRTKNNATSLGRNLATSKAVSYNIINKQAEQLAANIDSHIKRLRDGKGRGLWDVGVYLLSDKSTNTQSASMALRAITSGVNSYLEPIRVHDVSMCFKRSDSKKPMISSLSRFASPMIQCDYKDNTGQVIPIYNEFEHRNAQLTTYLTTEELSSFINLPTRSVTGVSVINETPGFNMTPPNIEADSISFGKLSYGSDKSEVNIGVPINTLNAHTLVAGINRSGKTNSVFNFLNGFAERNIPFMVIEPAKTEYVDWALKYNQENPKKQQIRIIMPGDASLYKGHKIDDGLYINPFEVLTISGQEPRVLSHIDRIKSIFATAFPMQDILPTIMENLIYAVYDIPSIQLNYTANIKSSEEDLKYNWFKPNEPNYRKNFPTLQVMKDRVNNVIRDLGYDLKTTSNLKGCMHTRLGSLTKGWKDDMLNNPDKTTDWSALLSQPCIINLSGVGDDVDRAFIMSLLLNFLYEYRALESSKEGFSYNNNLCKHLVVIEEAHRIMSNCYNPDLPQYKSAQMLSNLLSEVAAYGQGMMIVDQIPVRLIPDAIKNTNLKIIHKLVSSDDISTIGDSIGLTEAQKGMISRLKVGQAIMSGLNLSSEVYLTQVNKCK